MFQILSSSKKIAFRWAHKLKFGRLLNENQYSDTKAKQYIIITRFDTLTIIALTTVAAANSYPKSYGPYEWIGGPWYKEQVRLKLKCDKGNWDQNCYS
jgi:hypothetical protein